MSAHTRSSTRNIARAGLAGVATFPILVAVLNVIQLPGYSVVSDAMSDLALGRAGWLMTINFCVLAAGMLLTGVVIRRSLEGAVGAPLLLWVAGLLTFGSAVFQTDPTGAPMTTHGAIHQGLGITTYIILIATIAFAARACRRTPCWRGFGAVSILWAAVAFGTFFLVPILGDPLFGIAQRIFVGVCLLWMAAVNWRVTSGVVSEPALNPQSPATAPVA